MLTKKDEFLNNLKKHNIELSSIQVEQFHKYASLLIEWNEKMNLTAISESDEIYEKHFLDSLLLAYGFSIEGSFADVGSGAGFPSIPLKIVFPSLQVWIIEPLAKRCTFLRTLVSELGLENVQIINERAEDYVKEHREYFDIVSARAVANLSVLSELCIPLVKVSGQFIAMKGSQAIEEIEEAKYAIRVLGGSIEKTDHQDLYGNTRYNIGIRKIRSTPKKYPRSYAKIKKQPLRSLRDE